MSLASEHGLTPGPDDPEPTPLTNDVLIPPLPQAAGGASRGAPYGAEFCDTSEFMIGSVAVGIIFPESDGSIDPNSEDWTSAEESNVVSEIQAGLNWWATQEPNADLSFTYDIHYRVQTSYEPITRPHTDEGLWIDNVMTQLGYTTGEYVYKVTSYLNDTRATNGTEWAVAIFVVDDTNDPDKKFADGYFAYAYLGGPFIVMTYGNDGWGIGNMDCVTAHEMGHSFYATDEYDGIPEYSGYECVLDNNGAYCIMNQNSWNVCHATKGQIGWWDSSLTLTP